MSAGLLDFIERVRFVQFVNKIGHKVQISNYLSTSTLTSTSTEIENKGVSDCLIHLIKCQIMYSQVFLRDKLSRTIDCLIIQLT